VEGWRWLATVERTHLIAAVETVRTSVAQEWYNFYTHAVRVRLEEVGRKQRRSMVSTSSKRRRFGAIPTVWRFLLEQSMNRGTR
jgi:hypothetical protein